MSTNAVIALTPESVGHTLKGMYRSFQQCGAGATLASDKFKVTQFAERDTGSPDVVTHVRLTGQGDLKGYRLQITGPAIDTGDNPARSLAYWFGGNPPALEAIAHLLSAFGDEIDVPREVPFFGQVVRREADVEKTPVDMYCHIVVGMEPGTGDLITYRAESEDRKFRINTIPKSAIDGLAAVPKEQEAAVRFSYLVQKMGSRALAAMLDADQLTRLWDSNYRYQP